MSDAEGDVRLANVNLYNAEEQPRLGQDGSGFLVNLGNSGYDFITFVDVNPDTFTGVVAITFNADRDMSEYVSGSVIALTAKLKPAIRSP